MRDNRRHRGFSLLEILVIIAILGALIAVLMPFAGKAIRRARALSAISEMNRVLTQARLNAIKRGFQVIAQVTQSPTTGRVHLTIWEDRNPDFKQGTYTPPGGGAAVQEALLQEFDSEGTFHVWKHGGTMDDYSSGVAFNSYVFNGANDSSLKALVVFLPTGGIVIPQDSASGNPTNTDGRGIYIADEKGKNFFRLTVPSTYVAKVRVDKWIDSTTGYAPNNWTWF